MKNYETDYGYDGLDNLTSVTQKGDGTGNRNRTFVYDSLSRLTSAANPESGTITYTYSNSSSGCASQPGILCTKATPKPATTTYAYDALNRLTQKSYSDSTATAHFGYDGAAPTGCTTAPPTLTDSNPKPLRTAICDGSGAASWKHDVMGRALSESRTILTGNKTISYTYNSDGSLSTLTYPGSAKVVTYTQNGSSYTAGRPVSAVTTGTGVNYVTGATYAPFGGMASMTNGSATGFAGIVTTDTYNIRLQPLRMLSTSPTATVLNLCYKFNVGGGTTGTCAFSSGTSDNGSVVKIVNNRDTTRSQNFTYDSLNRIATAWTDGTGANSWGEVFTIDPWANQTQRNQYSGRTNSEGLSVIVNTSNQLTTSGYAYDAAGNMTNDGIHSYTYDAENRLLTAAGWTYVYDGDGNREIKCNHASPCPTSGTGTTYWRNMAGEVISEGGLGGSITEEYIFFNGGRIARRDNPSSVVHYYFADHLGTHGVVTNATGTYPFEQDMDYYPYGGMQHDYSTAPLAQNYKFTGKERDSESGLDEFGARNYSSSLGRFMIPDWAATATATAVPYAHFGNPQSLNLYTYVQNNPTTMGDPDGHAGDYAEPVPNPAAQSAACDTCDEDVSGGITTGVENKAAKQGARAQNTEVAQNQQPQQSQPQSNSSSEPNYKPGIPHANETNPGHPLSQNPDVKKASDQAFMTTTNGQARGGLAESGFAIDNKDGKIEIVNKVNSVNGDGKPNELYIQTDEHTIAILHTHGNKALATPSEGDLKSPVPNFVRSQMDLYVTVPGTTTYIQLQ